MKQTKTRAFAIQQKKAFTLIELIVAVIIVAVLAALAVPNYLKSVNRSYEQTAINQLKAIHTAERTYQSRAGLYWPPAVGRIQTENLADINTGLNLDIMASGLTFTCKNADIHAQTYECSAVRDGGAFTVKIDGYADGTCSLSCSGECDLDASTLTCP